ncbi:putative dehydrogenase [Owenweeksia hongkongensis DSM 17368]|uniref:Putative dehydrogenase n=1 Tax=Owenweeksia hongkongensis (strain DSM 17368 / CIP 108786 / JCM 12287 / NRRL B-23963 / UST20020801) TaxID=926562 RepID=G8R4E6_OWEHD|nr:Gfo/Idh/MocA family oxidoreductase [Owenweeksia hongkongensis]AEV34246.1 putative dehydrogenase [Owenweeksia hongkongensis DSM 17368]
MPQAEINFGIIGLGHIGKRHSEMIERHPEAKLSAICDIKNPENLGAEIASTPYYNNIDEMLSQENELDAVVVASPNGLHAEHALKCLDAKKHVVVEKPMTLTKADAEKVIYKALNVHKQLFVVMQNRYSPPNIWLKELIESGKLGRIFMVQINCYWNRDGRYYTGDNWHGSKDLDGGTLFTQFSHFIDIMYWLFGDITNIEGRLADFNHKDLTTFEDSGVVSFEFVNGGLGSINYSTAVYEKNLESSMTIIAENGSVKVGGQYMDKIEACHIKDYVMPKLPPTNPGNDYGAYKGSAANHSYIIENVVNVLKGRDSITTNALEGLKVVDIIEKIYRKSKSL